MKKLFVLLILFALLIPTQALAVTYDSVLTLDNKDTTTWARIADGRIGTLNYNSSGTTFDYSFTATGLEGEVPYSLIYYANPYPGNNPGALIGTGTSALDGTLTISGSPNIGNLPTPPDANMIIDHSVAPDNYTTAHGAKIWLVPSDCYDAALSKISVYSPTRFLFETDMLNYTDIDLSGGEGLPLTTIVTEPSSSIGLLVEPSAVTFGSVAIGSCSSESAVTLTNIGNVPIKVTASTSAGFYTSCLKINTVTANGWVSPTIPVGGNLIIYTKVCPTSGYSGTLTGTVSFMASFAP
jgi:hypothetical protein